MSTSPELPEEHPNYSQSPAAYTVARQEDVDLGLGDIEDHYRQAANEKAKKDMLYGALWCIGGTIATVAQTGFIFWGAIVFGGIQFFKGVASYRR